MLAAKAASRTLADTGAAAMLVKAKRETSFFTATPFPSGSRRPADSPPRIIAVQPRQMCGSGVATSGAYAVKVVFVGILDANADDIA